MGRAVGALLGTCVGLSTLGEVGQEPAVKPRSRMSSCLCRRNVCCPSVIMRATIIREVVIDGEPSFEIERRTHGRVHLRRYVGVRLDGI
jgi:hypothetical protein